MLICVHLFRSKAAASGFQFNLGRRRSGLAPGRHCAQTLPVPLPRRHPLAPDMLDPHARVPASSRPPGAHQSVITSSFVRSFSALLYLFLLTGADIRLMCLVAKPLCSAAAQTTAMLQVGVYGCRSLSAVHADAYGALPTNEGVLRLVACV